MKVAIFFNQRAKNMNWITLKVDWNSLNAIDLLSTSDVYREAYIIYGQ